VYAAIEKTKTKTKTENYTTMKKIYSAVTGWGLITGTVYGASVLSTVAAGQWGGGAALAIIGTVVAGCAKGYQVKFSRFTANVWGGRGVIQANDNGPAHYEVLLSRSKPSCIWEPLKHLFRPWAARIGKIDAVTGSISVTSRPISEVGKKDSARWELGTNERLTGSAAAHVFDKLSGYQTICDTDDEELTPEAAERYQTIVRLVDVGLQLNV
jgi:hypothetical protein